MTPRRRRSWCRFTDSERMDNLLMGRMKVGHEGGSWRAVTSRQSDELRTQSHAKRRRLTQRLIISHEVYQYRMAILHSKHIMCRRFYKSNLVWLLIHFTSVDGYIYGRSQIKVHIDERIQVHSARSCLAVTHPSTNRGRRCLTSVNWTCHWSSRGRHRNNIIIYAED